MKRCRLCMYKCHQMPDASSSVRRLKAIAILLGLVWLLNASAMPLTCNTIISPCHLTVGMRPVNDQDSEKHI